MKKITLALTPRVMRGAILTATLATSLLSPVYCVAAESTKSPAEITFLTWGEYISKDVVAKFEAEYKAKKKIALNAIISS